MTDKYVSSNASSASDDSNDSMWGVQEILAERKTLFGEVELLVVWKVSWIPKGNVPDGPVMQAFDEARKCKFAVGRVMHIQLPIEPKTTLARDFDIQDKPTTEKTTLARDFDIQDKPTTALNRHYNIQDAQPTPSSKRHQTETIPDTTPTSGDIITRDV
jgi:hypothetical protein